MNEAVLLRQALVEADFYGERAIVLHWRNMQAIVLPDFGANVVSYRDLEHGFALLHEPKAHEMADFKRAPYLYGIPILLPANRYDGGIIRYAGKRIQLPVNEVDRQTHLHGMLYDFSWGIKDSGGGTDESYVVLSVQVTKESPLYLQWPFCFTVELTYELNEYGLSQHLLVRNDGDAPMPCLFGFHTAINAPFVENGNAEDYRCRISIGERWELDHRGLPTGLRLSLNDYEQMMRDNGAYPFAVPMDNHYTALPSHGYNRMELLDTKNDVTLVYDVDANFRQWMVWNNDARSGFFCAEPQVTIVNAPNVNLPCEEIGLFPIKPKEVWEAHSRLYVRHGS